MKRLFSFLIAFLLLFPITVKASSDILLASVRNMPEDFRRYFFHSELSVQVQLNDIPLFEASMTIKENGQIHLNSIISPSDQSTLDTQEYWADVLRKGIIAGSCEKNCPRGLITSEYHLDKSTLKLYTSQYETARNNSSYIMLPQSMPNGLIIQNDLSAIHTTSNAQLWNLNSSWTSSLFDWTQRMSFQSAYSSDKYGYRSSDLYELFSQKEFAGSFLRLGFFTPDSDTGNVQTSGFSYDSVIGAMWGTSDILLESNSSVSAWPVYVNGRNQAIAEVYRDGRLIYSQQLQDGVQALDTRRLPGGIYDITINIIQNGQQVDTQSAQIYKPSGWRNPAQRWRMNLWTGQRQTVSSNHKSDETPLALGGSLDVLAWSGGILGISSTVTENNDYWMRLRSDITLSPSDSLFLQHTRTSVGMSDHQGSDIRYYRNLTAGSTGSLYWRNTQTETYRNSSSKNKQRGDVWGSSFSLRLPWSSTLTFNGEYTDTAWRRGFGTDLSLNMHRTLLGRQTDLRLSAYDKPGNKGQSRDQGGSFSLTISLFPSNPRHSVSAGVGMSDNHGYTNANYQWRPDNDNGIRWLGAGISHSSNNTMLSTNVGLDNRYFTADGYLQYASLDQSTTAGLNLSQALVVGNNRVMAGKLNRGQQSVMIIDVESEQPDDQIIASGKMSENRLKTGRNIIPVEAWQRDTLQFSTDSDQSTQLYPSLHHIQMNKGSVGYLQVKAISTRTFIAVLRDEEGQILRNRSVNSDISHAMINADGVLTLDIGPKTQVLTVNAENGTSSLICSIPNTQTITSKVQFENNVLCRKNTDENN